MRTDLDLTGIQPGRVRGGAPGKRDQPRQGAASLGDDDFLARCRTFDQLRQIGFGFGEVHSVDGSLPTDVAELGLTMFTSRQAGNPSAYLLFG